MKSPQIHELSVMRRCIDAIVELDDHNARRRVFDWLEGTIENAHQAHQLGDVRAELDQVRARAQILSKVSAALLSAQAHRDDEVTETEMRYRRLVEQWLVDMPEDEQPLLFDINDNPDGSEQIVVMTPQALVERIPQTMPLENNTDEQPTDTDADNSTHFDDDEDDPF